ncbi:MAG: hypothetical protein ABR555_18845 [Pyrinomonadaceae bacterium]
MKWLRNLLVLLTLLLIIAIAFLWYNLPQQVDMAAYAPADSFAYLEFNSPSDIAQAIEANETWKKLAPIIGFAPRPESRWMAKIARAGLAPAESVVFTRAQVAIVVVGLNTTESGETLRIKPDAAIIVETHTAQWRIKSAVLKAANQLAAFAYGQSTCSERTGDAGFIDCTSSTPDRKLIVAIDGSLVVVGNSDNAVRACLEARHGSRPTLAKNSELARMRSSIGSDKALAFGFISSANSARLFSWLTPLLLGKVPGDEQFEKLLAVSASKILRGIAWSSTASSIGVEDRFLFSLEPEVVSRLEPAFDVTQNQHDFWKFVPQDLRSLTIYRTQNPASGWTALDEAMSFKLDALSAVVFSSLLKTGLSVYGVENPKELLARLVPPVVTFRTNSSSSGGSVLVGRVANEKELRDDLARSIFPSDRGQTVDGTGSDIQLGKEFTALLVSGFVLVGKTEDVRACALAIRNQHVTNATDRIIRYSNDNSAAITTFADDESRIISFANVIASLRHGPMSVEKQDGVRSVASAAGFSVSDTTLTSTGIQRTTRSTFGQFSTLVSLLEADRPHNSR